MITFNADNYNKKTPATLKLWADIALVLIPFVETARAGCPDFAGKEWVFWGTITFLSVFKIVSKFFADHEV